MKNTVNSPIYKSIELFILFFIFPVLIASSIVVYAKFILGGVGVFYVSILLLWDKQWRTPKISMSIQRSFWIRIISLSILFLGIGIGILWIYDSSQLFKVVKTKPILWIQILFLYSFLSVLPQELIYRKFFYLRYENLFQNKSFLFCLNVLCFSLCHLFLKSFWVLLITIIGGILFTYTYEKTRSVLWTSIEHAIYGNLIFTVGLGTMLAFPS